MAAGPSRNLNLNIGAAVFNVLDGHHRDDSGFAPYIREKRGFWASFIPPLKLIRSFGEPHPSKVSPSNRVMTTMPE